MVTHTFLILEEEYRGWGWWLRVCVCVCVCVCVANLKPRVTRVTITYVLHAQHLKW